MAQRIMVAMSRPAWLFAPSGENLSFAIRCCVSVAVPLWLALQLGLGNAYWIFISVAMFIQPLPGFLIVRAFARLAGTLLQESPRSDNHEIKRAFGEAHNNVPVEARRGGDEGRRQLDEALTFSWRQRIRLGKADRVS